MAPAALGHTNYLVGIVLIAELSTAIALGIRIYKLSTLPGLTTANPNKKVPGTLCRLITYFHASNFKLPDS